MLFRFNDGKISSRFAISSTNKIASRWQKNMMVEKRKPSRLENKPANLKDD